MIVESVKISSLVLDPSNARKHATKNLDAIKGSLAKFDQQKPIVVGRNNVVIAGNGTLEAAKDLGWEMINIVRTDLQGTDATAFAIADNRTGELAEWDAAILSDTLKSLQDVEFDLNAIGFDDDDLAKLSPDPSAGEGLTDPDEVPEDAETRCKPGDLWILGKHRLLCGDSTNVQHVERLMGGEKADMVLTDPPYGVLDVEWDRPLSFDDVSMALMFSTGPVCMFNASRTDLMRSVLNFAIVPDRVAVWRLTSSISPGHGMFRTWQPIYVWRAGSLKGWDAIEWENASPDKTGEHPTQKPIGLLEKWLGAADAKSALDLFLGSGSTLIACEKIGRRCFGMEIDPKYCDVILTRWEKFTGLQAVLQKKGDNDAI